MALSLSQTHALTIIQPGMKVASLGYPDIIAPPELLETLFGTRANYVEMREDSSAICKRHGLKDRSIPDAVSFFKILGCKLHVYDIVQERGCERICDLNEPGALKYAEGFYDIVLDVGTSEHCINIWQALVNMAGMVKVGGHIIHENPFNQGNHGFFNLNPTLFVDFYETNGFEVKKCLLVSKDGRGAEIHWTKRFRFIEAEVNVFAMARRIAVQSFVFPIQSKYKGLIPAAGVDRAKGVVNG